MRRSITRWDQTAREPSEKPNTSRPGASLKSRECYWIDNFRRSSSIRGTKPISECRSATNGGLERQRASMAAAVPSDHLPIGIRNSVSPCRPMHAISELEPISLNSLQPALARNLQRIADASTSILQSQIAHNEISQT